MKKFLTVLLVIAVMFTFSFGSAFATGMSQEDFEASYSTTLGDQYFELAWADLVKVTAGSETVNNVTTAATYPIDKTVLNGLKSEAKAVYDYYMIHTATAYVTDASTLANTVLELGGDATNTRTGAFKIAVAAAQFAADKADALATLDTVPTYNYSTEVMSNTDATAAQALTTVGSVVEVAFVDKDYTYKAAAEKLVEYFKGNVEDKDDFDADVTVKAYKDASGAVAGIVSKAVLPLGYATYNTETPAKVTALALTGAYDLKVAYAATSANEKTAADGYTFPAGAIDGKFFDVNNDVNKWSTAAVDASNKTDAASVAAVKAMNAAKYASYVVGKDAAGVAYADKWLKVADALAEAGYGYGAGYDEAHTIAVPNGTVYATAGEKMVELEKYAAKYGAEKNAEGQLVRDAAVVQKYLEKGLAAIAKAGDANAAAKYTEYTGYIYNAKSEVIANVLTFEKDSVKKAVELLIADYEADEVFFDAELAKIKGYAETYLAKVEAADKADAVVTAYEGFLGKIKDVKTADELRKEYTDAMNAETDSAVKGLYTVAANYATYVNTNNGDDADLDTTTLKDRVAEMIGESGVRTTTEIKALKDEAVKVAQGLPTQDAVKAAKKALKAAIEALPAKATIADFAAVQAVSDAIDAYDELTTTSHGLDLSAYNTAITQIVSAYNAQFAQQVTTVSKTDDVAINKIYSDIEAAEEALDDLTATVNVVYMDGLLRTLDGYLKNIKANEKEAVEKAIAAIPLNVTDADKATVENARKLYDAYVAKYTDLEAVYDATTVNFTANTASVASDGYNKGYAADDIAIGVLTAAETTLGLNNDPEENAKAYVQDLKIVARSAKTSKGVKVTIKADVQKLIDEGFTVEYKFYRSTKSNAKFGTAKVTKTTNTYLNTSGKKGTRYYYKAKLVVKNAKGEVVATTPLTQCLYATRVF